MTMNDISRQRFALAQTIAANYLTNPHIKAVGLTGSVARGEADAYSDIDLSLYYSQLPSETELQLAYERNQGAEYRLYACDRNAGYVVEQYFVQGVKCDIGHVTVDRIEHDLPETLQQADPDTLMLKVLAGIEEMRPLYGASLIEQWKAIVTCFPDALAEAMVTQHLQFRSLWVLSIYGVRRNDLLFTQEQLLDVAKRVIGVLSGLNRIYYPAMSAEFKGMENLIERMTIAPENLAFRLKSLFGEAPDRSVALARELIEEVFALVEKHMPEIDTATARNHYMRWSSRYLIE